MAQNEWLDTAQEWLSLLGPNVSASLILIMPGLLFFMTNRQLGRQ